MRDAGVMTSAIGNEYVRDDAESTDVQVPNMKLKEHEIDRDEEEVRENFKNWLVSEDEVVQYNIEVPEKEETAPLTDKKDSTEGKGKEESDRQTVEDAKNVAKPNDNVVGEGTTGIPKGKNADTAEHETVAEAPEAIVPGGKDYSSPDTEAPLIPEEVAADVDVDPVKQLPGRERRGAPAGRRAAFEQFKSWYINDTGSRKKFLHYTQYKGHPNG